jgi:hypothetical protein
MESYKPFDCVPTPILSTILAFTDKLAARRVCKSWSIAVPAPRPLATIRDFGDIGAFDFVNNLAQPVKDYKKAPFQEHVHGGARYANGNEHEVELALVGMFRAILTKNPCVRNIFHPRGRDYAYVYSSEKWVKCPLQEVTRVVFTVIMAQLQEFLTRKVPYPVAYEKLRYPVVQIFRTYNSKPQIFARQGATSLMEVVHQMPPVVVWDL